MGDKPVLRTVYQDCYRRIVAHCQPGRTLEIGGGTGNLKSYLDEIISSDIQVSPWLIGRRCTQASLRSG